ncbi:MAG: MFS transporter, partial [Candidatus Rokubacteria bacterium]|nr:MFS transporter [Candidatus Rokubacteria bacterium]
LAFVLGIGLGGSQPMVMALLHDAVPEGRTGEAVGIRATVVTTSQTFMPLLFGALGSTLGVAPAFWAVAIALAAGSRVAKKRRTP